MPDAHAAALAPAASTEPARRPAARLARWLRALDRRWRLWALLSLLSLLMLGTLVWLTRNHEIDQMQRALERDAADTAQTLQQALARNLQDLHSLGAIQRDQAGWQHAALAMLQEHREWLRLEWRDRSQNLQAAVDSPYHPALGDTAAPSFLSMAPVAASASTFSGALGAASDAASRAAPAAAASAARPVIADPVAADARRACLLAEQLDGAAYAASRYVLRGGGRGEEVMTLCLPLLRGQQRSGYVLATYSLGGMLNQLLGDTAVQRHSVALTEPDGTRLAMRSGAQRVGRRFSAQHLLDLPGNALVLRLEGGRAVPDLLPNVLTALVTVLSVALVTVLGLLARDFRARQRAESELADALAFRKAMEDSLVTGLRARDLQGRITYVNPAFCAMVGWSAHELMGHDAPMPYWPPERADDYTRRQAVRLAAGHMPPREGSESLFMRKDGTRFPVLIIEAPLINAQGVHTGWMGAVLDMTAQRQAEELSRTSQERLQASARLATVGEMASLMSHELNQPLAAISSYANGSLNLLGAGPANGPAAQAAPGAAAISPDTLQDLRTALSRIAEQASRAGRVINSVHDLVRRRSNAREAVAPAALVEAVLPLVQLQARKLDAQVHLHIPADLPLVWCEPTMVEQVLLNLARNGLQAMAHTAGARQLHLHIRHLSSPYQPAAARGSHGRVEFRITDTGEGISPEVARQIYTPFFTTKPEGMGLGLSLCRTVIEQHGGTLHHQPHDPQGTVFHFTLPLARPHAAG